jgi:hypothetical protein
VTSSPALALEDVELKGDVWVHFSISSHCTGVENIKKITHKKAYALNNLSF